MLYIYDVYLVCNDGRLKTKKKIEFFHFFAECHDHDTRQSWESGTLSFPALPSDMGKALGKENKKTALPSAYLQHSAKKIQKKKKTSFAECQMQALGKAFKKTIKNTFLCRVPTRGTRQRGHHCDLAITAAFLCRVPSWHSGNPLPSARHATLDKEAFAVKGYADNSLPSAALGKGFVECKAFFAECNCTRQSTRLL